MITTTDKGAVDNTLTNSLEIAKLTGKAHSNVKRDIINLETRHAMFTFEEEEYKDTQNRTQKLYLLSATAKKMLLTKYQGALRVPLGLEEEAALKTIEQLLNVSLERQYTVGSFRIDGYDKVNKIAYEIDEGQHKYSVEQDKEREAFIKSKLGCTFVRIDVSR